MTPIAIHWTAYLTALSTPLLALFAGIIAANQWRVAHAKLKLDLFDRRFKLYKSARGFVFSVLTDKNLIEQMNEFSQIEHEARFLFGDDIGNLTGKLYSRALIFTMPRIANASEAIWEVDENGIKRSITRKELRDWFSQVNDDLHNHFKPYLKIQSR